MYRLALNKLIKWKDNPRRKPLIVWGARQVGKKYLIKEMFAKDFYKDNYVYIDFAVETDIRDYCETEFNPKKITRDQIHNGLQYIFGDALSAGDVNAIVEGLLYLLGFGGEIAFGNSIKANNAKFTEVKSDRGEIDELAVNTLQSGLQHN